MTDSEKDAAMCLLRRIFENNPSLAFGEGEFNQAELDLLRTLKGGDA